MAHFGMLGRAVGIGRKRHVMVYRSHVGGLLVGSSRLWRAMTHRGMLGRAARSLRFHVHARHAVMIHLLRRRFGHRLRDLGRRMTRRGRGRSEEHTSELQSLMRNSYAVF